MSTAIILKRKLSYKKTIRNKAIKATKQEHNKLFWSHYNNGYGTEYWSLPNAFFAIRGDIYTDYIRTKKDVDIEEEAPLGKILDGLSFVEELKNGEKNEELTQISFDIPGEPEWLPITLDARFYDLIRDCYQYDSIRWTGDFKAPVGFFVGDELVAVQMPVRI